MSKRKIIEIDRGSCNGCGLCTTACAEGALALDQEKKAVLVKEIYCDGMGACLNVCPVGALKIVEKESAGYDPQAAYDYVMNTRGIEAAQKVHGGAEGDLPRPSFLGCPGTMDREIRPVSHGTSSEKSQEGNLPSELSQWPIQLHLIFPQAPYFQGCDLLIAADCTAFALGSFHRDLLKGKKVVIACPKLDDTGGYVEKLTELFKHGSVASITVAMMEVPCCSGLWNIVRESLSLAGSKLSIQKVVIRLEGSIRS